MEEIGERRTQSNPATTSEGPLVAANTTGFPVIVRTACALGGLGCGSAQNEEQLEALRSKAFATSPQCGEEYEEREGDRV